MNFPANSYKDLEMLILPTPILILTRVIFSGLWRHLHSRGEGMVASKNVFAYELCHVAIVGGGPFS